ncbi:MAG TPA: homoserine kinase [Marmoricola sp.]|nr:homoserine kinase [Marmoricola sp.]
MSRFSSGPVSVEVPATSANLGPGFDCLGLALDLHDTLTAEVVDTGLSVEVEGEGADDLPRDESHLVVRAMRAGFEALGVAPTGLALRATNRIPQSRGLGSSSAAIVGGLALARALVEGGADALDESGLLRLATAIEGHPDNVAPALLGGLVVSGQTADDVWAQRAALDPSISVVAYVPADGVLTTVARGLLPGVVPHADAAANTGRAALLMTAFAGATDRLLRGTEDFLHQSFREAAMPDSLALVRTLREDGVPAIVSGAGPTVLAFTAPGLPGAEDLLRRCPAGWQGRALLPDVRGAVAV